MSDEGGDERRLPDTRRAGDTDHSRLPGLGIELADEWVGQWITILDEGDRSRERTPIRSAHTVDELLVGELRAVG